MQHSFDTEDAMQFGVNAAVILHHIRFWIMKNHVDGTNRKDDRTWTYSTIEGFKQWFPYLSTRQLRTAIEKLLASGTIMTGNYNEKHGNQTKWYALVMEADHLSKLTTPFVISDKSTIREDSKQKISTLVPKTYSPEFEEVWAWYPKRAGGNPKAKAATAYAKQCKQHRHDDLLSNVQLYAKYIEHTGKLQTEYVKQASTFFGRDFDIDCQWELPHETSNAEPQQTRNQLHADYYRKVALADNLGGCDIREDACSLRQLVDEADRRDGAGGCCGIEGLV